MRYFRDAGLPRAVFLLFGALSAAMACLWLAGGALPAEAHGGSGRAPAHSPRSEVQPAPGTPDQPPSAPASTGQARKTIYWGAFIAGDTYGRGNPPWDEGAIDLFEEHAGKKLSILHWGQAWWRCRPGCGYQEFRTQQPQFEAMRKRGVIPLLDWGSWDSNASRQDQPEFSLQKIIDGKHDAYLRRWAGEARDWGHPFFLRFDWEMNGNWFPWSEALNGNGSGQFVQAWRHVHDIFRAAGANNVTWVWCANVVNPKEIPLAQVYPGDAYVDWTCMDGYNWGVRPPRTDRWRSFSDVFGATYAELLQLSPHKPIMIGETGSSEVGGSKAEWITSTLGTELPAAFPRVEAIVWFNWNTEGMGWTIESSPAAQAAFASAIAAPYYSSEKFDQLPGRAIPPSWALPGKCGAGGCVYLPQVGK